MLILLISIVKHFFTMLTFELRFLPRVFSFMDQKLILRGKSSFANLTFFPLEATAKNVLIWFGISDAIMPNNMPQGYVVFKRFITSPTLEDIGPVVILFMVIQFLMRCKFLIANNLSQVGFVKVNHSGANVHSISDRRQLLSNLFRVCS